MPEEEVRFLVGALVSLQVPGAAYLWPPCQEAFASSSILPHAARLHLFACVTPRGSAIAQHLPVADALDVTHICRAMQKTGTG